MNFKLFLLTIWFLFLGAEKQESIHIYSENVEITFLNESHHGKIYYDFPIRNRFVVPNLIDMGTDGTNYWFWSSKIENGKMFYGTNIKKHLKKEFDPDFLFKVLVGKEGEVVEKTKVGDFTLPSEVNYTYNFIKINLKAKNLIIGNIDDKIFVMPNIDNKVNCD